jgi:uncharacterized membrane protein YccC
MMAGWRSLLARYRARALLALRMTVSAMVTFAVAEALHLPQGYWAVLTAIIVTQANTGGSLKAALDRLVGSVCGALVGAGIGLLLPVHTPFVVGIGLFVAVAPLTLLTAFYPTYRIAPITAIIVLLSTGAASLGPISYAIDRILEIALGSAIGLAGAVLIVPTSAQAQVCEIAGQVATLLAGVLTILAPAVAAGAPDLGQQPAAVQAALNRLGTAAEEAQHERRSRLADHPDLEPLFRTLRRLQQDTLALYRLVRDPWPEGVHSALAAPWAACAEAAAATLRGIAASLPARHAPPDSAGLANAVATYLAAIEDLRREGRTRDMPTEAVGRIYGSAFRVEQLQRDLGDLIERVREIAELS